MRKSWRVSQGQVTKSSWHLRVTPKVSTQPTISRGPSPEVSLRWSLIPLFISLGPRRVPLFPRVVSHHASFSSLTNTYRMPAL